jgi:chemotaxis protein MotB
MPKETWMIASVLTVALLLGLLTFSSCDKKVRLDQAQAELQEAKTATARTAAEAALLRDKLAADEQHLQELQKENDAAVQSHQSLEDEMRSALESKDVTISQLQGKLTVNILDRILFDSGEADLKVDGSAVLRKIAGILEQHTNLQIHVVGHTDNVPIRPGARSRFASNWELSTARATAAVRFLAEKAGVDPRRLGAVGYGEFRPVADNSTPEGRAKNRRIAITILSEEMAGADIASSGLQKVIPPGDPPVSPAALSTNNPPEPSTPSRRDESEAPPSK